MEPALVLVAIALRAQEPPDAPLDPLQEAREPLRHVVDESVDGVAPQHPVTLADDTAGDPGRQDPRKAALEPLPGAMDSSAVNTPAPPAGLAETPVEVVRVQPTTARVRWTSRAVLAASGIAGAGSLLVGGATLLTGNYLLAAAHARGLPGPARDAGLIVTAAGGAVLAVLGVALVVGMGAMTVAGALGEEG